MSKILSRAIRITLPTLAMLALVSTGVWAQASNGPVLVIHGGAGTILRENMTPEREEAYRGRLTEALRTGFTILDEGGSSLDAVEATIRVMEDSPLFNAGIGAVFTHAGTNELDASIMDGATLSAGAVAGVRHVKNPITLARRVMENSRHVMLTGAGAEEFALEQGVELVPAEYFFTQRRWQSLQRARERERSATDGARAEPSEEAKFGTVGAVALDRHGNLAAGTSTGGTTNKRWGRVGDSPVIGAGTYADNASCGVSATGTGEYFIRNAVAHDICARVQYLGVSLEQAAEDVVLKKLVDQGGDGGIVALDRDGNIAMTFNTPGMYRGHVGPDGQPHISIYGE
jgi:beta-aspartyl-peptidase (threonine type)